MCWTAPANVSSIRRGELKCVTGEQATELEQAIATQREEERQRRLAAEQEKRRREEERRVAARKAEQAKRDEKQRAELKRKQEQDATARKQAEEQLKKAIEQQRQAELQRAAKLRDEELRKRAGSGENCDFKKIQAIANGQDPNKVVCGAVNPNSQVATQPSPQAGASAEHLEYLRRNAVRLQPEERKVTVVPPPTGTPVYGVCTTFLGGRCPTAEDALREEARRAEEALKEAERLDQQQRRDAEEARKAWEKWQKEEARRRAQEEKEAERAAQRAPETTRLGPEYCGWWSTEKETRRRACAAEGGGILCEQRQSVRSCDVLGKCGDWQDGPRKVYCRKE